MVDFSRMTAEARVERALADPAKEDFLKFFHRVCVFPDQHGRGYWWANTETASGFPLKTEGAAWEHAWIKLVENS